MLEIIIVVLYHVVLYRMDANSNNKQQTQALKLFWQVHIRRGRPHERFLFQTAEVVVTAAAVCMITLATNHIRHRGNSKQFAGEGNIVQHRTGAQRNRM